MKTTIDIPENELRDAIKYARAKTKRDAVVTAVVDYNRRQRMADLIKYSGSSDTLMSNPEIEALDENDSQTDKSKPRRRGRRS
ncbi:MAG: type II toxin-antitoxin system VapB family antitoxin [Acidobacteriia bacterium]|nr:type II toxin-antitoxin system VapB family antitoxin [Terriglobia bacterium]